MYGISDKTIRNWIESASQGKTRLELYYEGDKAFIADSLQNSSILDELVLRSRKYRNKRSHQRVKPSEEFYKLYNHQQIDEIIRSLEVYKEFPQHHRFRGEGAKYFDAYLQKLYKAGKNNHLTASTKLIDLNIGYLDSLLSDYEKVNVIDLGVGNGLASKELLGYFTSKGKLHKYIGIDISPELLDITERNLKTRFKDITIEKYIKDIAAEGSYSWILQANNGKQVLNLFLLLGGLIINFRKPEKALQMVCSIMHKNDFLITTTKLDNKESRSFFDFNSESDINKLPRHNKHVLELLNIQESFFEVEQFFSPKTKCRYIQIRLNIALSIHFNDMGFDKEIHYQKGDAILLWRAQHYNTQELMMLYKNAGFTTMQTSKTEDEAFTMMISRITPVDNHLTP
jgi:uncharacterized SAM-dependent methyltransferase